MLGLGNCVKHGLQGQQRQMGLNGQLCQQGHLGHRGQQGQRGYWKRWGLIASVVMALGGAVSMVTPAVAAPSSTGAVNITIGGRSDPNVERLLPDYAMSYDRVNRVVALHKKDGSAKAFVQILPAAAHLSTTKAYAQDVMDSYSGWGLTAQITRRGFSFQYVDNAPCAGLLTYFDGTSYLLFGACGLISQEEMTKAFSLAKLQLGLDDITYRSSMPSAYY